MDLDDRIGLDTDAPLSAADQAFADDIARAAKRAKDRPQRFAGFLNGLLVDGTINRPGVRAALQPYLKLPKPEGRTLKRARMAEAMVNAMAARGTITFDDIHAAGFTDAEILDLKDEAWRAARLTEMAA